MYEAKEGCQAQRAAPKWERGPICARPCYMLLITALVNKAWHLLFLYCSSVPDKCVSTQLFSTWCPDLLLWAKNPFSKVCKEAGKEYNILKFSYKIWKFENMHIHYKLWLTMPNPWKPCFEEAAIAAGRWELPLRSEELSLLNRSKGAQRWSLPIVGPFRVKLVRRGGSRGDQRSIVEQF